MSRRLLLASGGTGAFTVTRATSTLTTSQDGGWTQASDPHAIHGGGITVFGYVDLSNGNIEVRSVPDGSSTASASFTLHAALDQDTHAAPALIFRSDGRIVAAYSGHDVANIYARVSTNPYDVSAWGTEQSLDATLGGVSYTYCTLVYLGDDLYLYYRDVAASVGYLAFSVSHDDGATWSTQTRLYSDTLADGGLSYWKIDSDGSRIDFAVSNKRTASPNTKVFHFYFDGTSYRQSDGTVITGLPFEPADLTEVYDGGDGLGWAFDIIAGAHAAFAYAVVDSGSTNSYRYARWTGSAWSLTTIASSGGYIDVDGEGNVFAASVSLDHSQPLEAYANVKAGSHWEVQRFMADSGYTAWAKVTDVTSGSSDDNLYVTAVRDYGSGPRVLWLYGAYTGSPPYQHATFGVKAWG